MPESDMDSVTVTLIQLEKLCPARKGELNMSLNYLYKMHRTQIEELIERGCNVAFIPLGPTEVHGPHLPLWCDIVSGLDLAERAAQKLQDQGIESVIATPVTYCEADVTNVFAGNTSLRPETVAMMFEDICLSLARAGFVKIIVVSGHADPLNAEYVVKGFEAAKVKNPAINAIYSDWFSMITSGAVNHLCKGEHPEWDLHAGEIETSFIMNRYPELVDEAQIRALPVNHAGEFLFAKVAEGADNFIDCGAPDCYFGSPSLACAETGEKTYDAFSDFIVKEALDLLSLLK